MVTPRFGDVAVFNTSILMHIYIYMYMHPDTRYYIYMRVCVNTQYFVMFFLFFLIDKFVLLPKASFCDS